MYPHLKLELWRRRIRQNELAKRLQIDETVLSKILNGIRRPSEELQHQIAAILEMDRAWLFETPGTSSTAFDDKPGLPNEGARP
jgi:transcriptional regulator with XRE-family HTH domain